MSDGFGAGGGVCLTFGFLFMVLAGILRALPNSGRLQRFFNFSSVTIANIQKFDSLPNEYVNGWTVLTLVGMILFVVGIILLVVGYEQTVAASGPSIQRGSTTVINPAISQSNLRAFEKFGDSGGNNNNTVTYKPIGYGPAIDRTKIQNWLNGSISGEPAPTGTTTWQDGNGVPINIPTEQFKALYGFIPPSFVYYPEGQESNDYNGTNYENGRQNCMQACALTNCIAVQTEVPENCSQETTGCGGNSEFSCTLFYPDLPTADDAYWKIGNFTNNTNSPGCFTNVGSSCLGRKYYEDNVVPTVLPDNTVPPSQASTKFCDPTVLTSSSNNSCVARPLLTTEYVQSNHPYYILPINVPAATGKLTGDYSMLVPSVNYIDGVGTKCGYVNNQLVSCTGDHVCSQGESSLSTSNCWEIDNTAGCSGSQFDQNSGSTALATYKKNYSSASPPGSNYSDLYNSCYYRQQLTAVQPVQFNCDPTTVQRGCWGSPPIIATDSLSPGGFSACSDTTMIPTSQRCQSGASGNLASCTGFPYSCSTNNGTNTLWVANGVRFDKV